MGRKEKQIIDNRLKNLADNERLFRINSGMAWTGSEYTRKGDILVIRHPRPFHGMPTGFPDLIGWEEKIIHLDMVGQKIAVFKAEEVKATGGLSKEQEMFKKLIMRMGGEFRVLK